MRLFLAVFPPQTIISELVNLQAKFTPLRHEITPVQAKNLHLTLEFLGEVSEAEYPELIATCKEAFAGLGAAEVGLTKVRIGFPKQKKPHVVLVSASSQVLTEASKRFSHSLPYFHFTLARIKKGVTPKQMKQLHTIARHLKINTTFTAKDIALVESNPTPEGSNYKIVKRFRL